MKIDDIFEAMTDIDDKFIEAARPLEMTDSSTATAKPAPRRAMWKTLVPAAAFVAVVAAAGVVGVNYIRGYELRTDVSPSVAASLKEYWYPDEAEYVVSDDIKYLGFAYPTTYVGGPSRFDASADYAGSYKELEKKSDLIVSGTFIDVIHQTSDSKETWSDGDPLMMSYNWFEVSGVIKGDITAGSVLTIGQNSTINSANGNDDKYNVFTCDQLSPMLKGDKWIYFLKLEEDGTFSPVNGPQGRYPLPNHTNKFISWDGETTKLDKFSTYENAAPAREEIYEELLKKLAETEIKATEFENITIPVTSFTTIEMPEFPDVEFNVSRLGVTANDADIFDMKDGETLENLYLADLNNDGKRELCATISGERKRVEVCSYGNGSYHTRSGSRDYFLSSDTGELILNDRFWYSSDHVASRIVEFSLENLILTVPNDGARLVTLDNGQKVCPEEFPEFAFTANSDGILVDETDFDDVSRVIFGGFELRDLSLEDINGDGKRELVATTTYDVTLVYNIETGETFRGTSTASLSKADVMDYSKASWENQGQFTLSNMEGFRRFVLCGDEWGTRLDFDYELKSGVVRVYAEADAAYFCDLDGDGQREIIITNDTDGVWVYGVMDGDRLGRAHYHAEDGGRVVEQNGRLLIQYDNGVSEIGYKNSDLKQLHVDPLSDGFKLVDIPLDIYHSLTFNPFLPVEDVCIEIEDGTLHITRDGKTAFKTGKLGELYGITDAENERFIFVYSNLNNNCLDAYMISGKSLESGERAKFVCLNDNSDKAFAPAPDNDTFIEFKDGTRVSLSNLISLIDNS